MADSCEKRSNDETEELSVSKKMKKEKDYRIMCTNGSALDKIYNIAVSNATKMADSIGLKENKDAFISRFSEAFKSSLQHNVTVNGATWVPAIELNTSMERAEQKMETKDELLNRLSVALEKTTQKRRKIPTECLRISRVRNQTANHNLSSRPIQHNVDIPSTAPYDSDDEKITRGKITKISESLTVNNDDNVLQSQTLDELLQTVEYANQLQNKQNLLMPADSGYLSQ